MSGTVFFDPFTIALQCAIVVGLVLMVIAFVIRKKNSILSTVLFVAGALLVLVSVILTVGLHIYIATPIPPLQGPSFPSG